MRTAGIVAEYNPFHLGHAYQIEKTREAGYSHIVAVMSGNYTQRGEPACLLKEARCKTAISCGVDLVIELPLPYATASAERFAFGAVLLLDALGCCDALSFGSESGDLNELEECADAVQSLQGHPELRAQLKGGVSFPAARAAAAKAINPGTPLGALSDPNDTLGIEYIKSLRRLSSKMAPLLIKRAFAEHDSLKAEGPIASASMIRGLLDEGNLESARNYLPAQAFDFYQHEISEGRAPVNRALYGSLVLSQLRRMSAEEIAALPDVTEGLENRIFTAVQKAASLEDFYRIVKTKRYTLSRIRRIALYAFLGLDRQLAAIAPPYLRVLGFNARGLEILSRAKTDASLPIVTKYAQINALGDEAKRVFSLECLGSDLYTLLMPKPERCGNEQRLSAIKVI